ncbi:MAG: hypothetical protein ACLQUY_25155 [Ktedonobacterales bacterium]
MRSSGEAAARRGNLDVGRLDEQRVARRAGAACGDLAGHDASWLAVQVIRAREEQSDESTHFDVVACLGHVDLVPMANA